MNAADFLQLAVKLCNSSDEAHLRTAVSRAYYGAFHLTRELCVDFGVRFPATDNEHFKLPKCLINSGCEPAEFAGKLLDGLRIDRNAADYRLDLDRFQKPITARGRVLDAQRLDDFLRQCRTGPHRAAARNGIRRYAQSVLGVPLVD